MHIQTPPAVRKSGSRGRLNVMEESAAESLVLALADIEHKSEIHA